MNEAWITTINPVEAEGELLNTYQVKYESTIFLVALVQSLTINILNSLKGMRKVDSSIKIEKILNNYKCHSDIVW